jgi:hypothetical protein
MLLIGCLTLLCAGPAAAAQIGDVARILREGERLVFDVTWMGIKAGQATLESQGVVQFRGHPAYHLMTTAQSNSFISKFYRVDDRNASYLDVSGLRSLRFEKHLREGRYRHSSFTDFDHEGKTAYYRYLDFTPVPKNISKLEEAEKYSTYTKKEFPLVPGSLDELSVLYYVRGLPLVEGQAAFAHVFASSKNWDLEVRVLRRETLDTVLGSRETLVVEPLLKFEGIFQQKGRVLVWLTNDPERIPVMMKSEVVIGSFVSTLTRREVGIAQARAAGQEVGQP